MRVTNGYRIILTKLIDQTRYALHVVMSKSFLQARMHTKWHTGTHSIVEREQLGFRWGRIRTGTRHAYWHVHANISARTKLNTYTQTAVAHVHWRTRLWPTGSNDEQLTGVNHVLSKAVCHDFDRLGSWVIPSRQDHSTREWTKPYSKQIRVFFFTSMVFESTRAVRILMDPR